MSASRSGELDFLRTLEDIIDGRLAKKPAESYVARLAASGERRVAQKVGEEAVELALAAAAGDRAEQLDEAADLLFHLLILLRTKDLHLAEVATTLERRHHPP
ncbi:MAG TPA: phosphoribosyl-ATP diphosphatase [Woeseiaceae bacterium]